MNATWKRIIAAVQMIGGVLGIPVTIYYTSGIFVDIPIVLITTIFVGLYILSFSAGWLLWKNHPRGIVLSILVQTLQIPFFNIPRFSYSFISGLGGLLYIQFHGSKIAFNLYFQVLSSWDLHIGYEAPPSLIGLNFLALACLIYLRRQQKSETPQTYAIVEDIDRVIQNRLKASELSQHSIQIQGNPDGVNILIDGKTFSNLSEIEDIEIRELIQSVLDEWSNRKS